MLEVLLIMFTVYACLLMPLRGKEFNQLTPKQQQRVEKHYRQYMFTLKGRKTPNLTIEEYLPILHKQAITYLIWAIVLFPLCICFEVLAYYSRAFGW